MGTSTPTVVVGIDGSPNSNAALAWALAYLSEHGGGVVRAVLSWSYAPAAATATGFGFGGVLPPADAMQSATTEALDAYLDDVVWPEGVSVEKLVVEGPPSHAIVNAADNADLIVVGKRGVGGFLGLLLGSVATQVANHAPCPVVIVPADGDEG